MGDNITISKSGESLPGYGSPDWAEIEPITDSTGRVIKIIGPESQWRVGEILAYDPADIRVSAYGFRILDAGRATDTVWGVTTSVPQSSGQPTVYLAWCLTETEAERLFRSVEEDNARCACSSRWVGEISAAETVEAWGGGWFDIANRWDGSK